MDNIWPISFEAQKVGFSQNFEGGIVLRLAVHRNSDCVAVLAAIPMKFVLKVVLEPEEGSGSVSPQTERNEGSLRARTPARPPLGQTGAVKTEAEKAVGRAHALAAKARFQFWASEHSTSWSNQPSDALEFIHHVCEVISCKEFVTNPQKLRNFLAMEAEYLMATGQMAEER